jgi:integrase
MERDVKKLDNVTFLPQHPNPRLNRMIYSVTDFIVRGLFPEKRFILLFQTLGKHGPYQERGLTHKSVDCLIKSVIKKALFQKRVHPHLIRHTFATTLLDNGNDPSTVQALMGDSHIRTTERYLHSNDDRKVEAIQSLQFGDDSISIG